MSMIKPDFSQVRSLFAQQLCAKLSRGYGVIAEDQIYEVASVIFENVENEKAIQDIVSGIRDRIKVYGLDESSKDLVIDAFFKVYPHADPLSFVEPLHINQVKSMTKEISPGIFEVEFDSRQLVKTLEQFCDEVLPRSIQAKKDKIAERGIAAAHILDDDKLKVHDEITQKMRNRLVTLETKLHIFRRGIVAFKRAETIREPGKTVKVIRFSTQVSNAGVAVARQAVFSSRDLDVNSVVTPRAGFYSLEQPADDTDRTIQIFANKCTGGGALDGRGFVMEEIDTICKPELAGLITLFTNLGLRGLDSKLEIDELAKFGEVPHSHLFCREKIGASPVLIRGVEQLLKTKGYVYGDAIFKNRDGSLKVPEETAAKNFASLEPGLVANQVHIAGPDLRVNDKLPSFSEQWKKESLNELIDFSILPGYCAQIWDHVQNHPHQKLEIFSGKISGGVFGMHPVLIYLLQRATVKCLIEVLKNGSEEDVNTLFNVRMTPVYRTKLVDELTVVLHDYKSEVPAPSKKWDRYESEVQLANAIWEQYVDKDATTLDGIVDSICSIAEHPEIEENRQILDRMTNFYGLDEAKRREVLGGFADVVLR